MRFFSVFSLVYKFFLNYLKPLLVYNLNFIFSTKSIIAFVLVSGLHHFSDAYAIAFVMLCIDLAERGSFLR